MEQQSMLAIVATHGYRSPDDYVRAVSKRLLHLLNAESERLLDGVAEGASSQKRDELLSRMILLGRRDTLSLEQLRHHPERLNAVTITKILTACETGLEQFFEDDFTPPVLRDARAFYLSQLDQWVRSQRNGPRADERASAVWAAEWRKLEPPDQIRDLSICLLNAIDAHALY